MPTRAKRSAWVSHVMKYRSAHACSLKEAMQGASKTWKHSTYRGRGTQGCKTYTPSGWVRHFKAYKLGEPIMLGRWNLRYFTYDEKNRFLGWYGDESRSTCLGAVVLLAGEPNNETFINDVTNLSQPSDKHYTIKATCDGRMTCEIQLKSITDTKGDHMKTTSAPLRRLDVDAVQDFTQLGLVRK